MPGRPSLLSVWLCLVFLPGLVSAQPDVIEEVAEGLRLTERQATLLSHHQGSLATSGVRVVRLRPDALASDGPVRLGPDLVLARARTETRGDGSFSWFGERSATSEGLLVVRGPDVTGAFRRGTDRYELRPLTGGLHALVHLDPRGLPPDHPSDASASATRAAPSPDASSPPPRRSGEPPTIGVVVAYTPEAADAVGDVPALAQLSIDQTNESYANAGLDVRVELVHVYETPTSTTSNIGQDLLQFRAVANGAFDEIHRLRYEHGGDLAILIGDSAGAYQTCGLAAAVHASEADAFAVVAHDCATTSYTFAHELGHLQGARHNPENDATLMPFPYGHGLRDTKEGFRTIMALNSSACPGGWCDKLLTWSNPDVLHEGTPTGDPDRRDNARVLRETAAGIAALRTADGAPRLSPSVPRLDLTIAQGDSTAVSLRVSNAGGNVLIWNLALDQDPVLPDATGLLVPTEGRDGYAWWDNRTAGSPVTYRWVDRAPGTRASTNTIYRADLPFVFPFFDSTYRYVDVHRHGVASLHNEPSGYPPAPPFWQRQLPDSSGGAFLAPFWDALTTFGPGQLGRLRTWEPGPGEFAMEWTDLVRFDGSAPNTRYTFQTVLGSDGSILYQYRTLMHPVYFATVGLQAGQEGKSVEIAHQSSYPGEGLAIRVEPGVPWLVVSDRARPLARGESQLVEIGVDARRLQVGSYSATFSLRSDGFGVFTSDTTEVPVTLRVLPSTASADAPDGSPVRWSPAAPNPTSSVAHLTVDLARARDLSVTVFDVTGREVARLADGMHGPGRHAFEWDTRSTSPGVYLVRLTSGEQTETQRITVMR